MRLESSSKIGLTMSAPDKLALYVHWPYCDRICPYCDFNIYKNRPSVETALVAAILADMQAWRKMSGPRELISIHFGGGTPSLLSQTSLKQMIAQARRLWTATDDLEVGLEANPKDINQARLKAWRAAGIERLSIGVQSFDDKALVFLGRDHDGAQAEHALEQACAVMPRVSLDLIYGFSGQNIQMLERDIDRAIASGVGHISAYQLTIEAKTAFGKAQARGQNKVVGVDESADYFEHVMDALDGSGFDQYEVSNFAKTGKDHSRHNLAYWQGLDYAGVGPGAHGRLALASGRLATITALKPDTYKSLVRKTGCGIAERENLELRAVAEEYVLMGLRIKDGISLEKFRALAGDELNSDKLTQFLDLGLLLRDGDRLSASRSGRLVLDSLSHHLLS